MIVRPTFKRKIFYALIYCSITFIYAHSQNTIAVIGTGYVGLVSGACLAEIGNFVICADIDSEKIKGLQEGIIPIYEQGLTEIVARNVEAKRLAFTDNIALAIKNANIIFITVGTPMSDDGSADLSYIDSVISIIAKNINSHKIIVTKSTVPVGTGKKIRSTLENEFNIDPTLFSLASNPEFLREGLAIYDFLHPDRIVLGTDSDKALIALCDIYEQLISTGTPHVLTDISTAEMIKYASNSFLAVKISFINEIANLCDKTNANAKVVAEAMGLDRRIGPLFLMPGPGFGGSCFPKDSQALIYTAKQHNLNFHTVQAAIDANKLQQQKPVEKLVTLMQKKGEQIIAGKIVAVLGLAFKAHTDDVRYSPAITTIQMLLEKGATVKAYDPIAMPNMKYIFPDIIYGNTLYETIQDVDAIIILTEWDEIKNMNFARVKDLVKQAIIVDARNVIDPEILKQLGFMCDNIGQSYLCKKNCGHLRKLVPIHLRKRLPSHSVYRL